jgi:hypothetical protein
MLPPIYSPSKKKDMTDTILRIKNESRNNTKQRLYGALFKTASSSKIENKSPPKPLKRPPIFPATNKT